jgi:hypothetical protein
MSQDTNVENLIINKLTRAQYESITTPDPTQLYFITDEGESISTLDDVSLNNIANGQILKYNATTQKWENSAAGGGGTWGSITGTLSDQTDLQDALDAKQDQLTAGDNITIEQEEAAWTPAVQDTNLGSHNWQALAYDGSKLVALSTNGYISTSTDGTTWTPAVQDSNLGYNWSAMTYGNNKFVAITFGGSDGYYFSTSTDGTAWTTRVEVPFLSYEYWYGLAYGNGKFVALCSQGYISTSTDGTTWTQAVQDSNLGNHDWKALAYDGSKFVALSRMGYISTSTDGTTWTQAVQDTNLGYSEWQALAYDGSKFVALGYDGYISISTDGTTWTEATEDTNLGYSEWQALASDGNKFVALSNSGYTSQYLQGGLVISATAPSPTWGSITGTLSDQTDLQTALNGKQATLVSGTNIKTINNNSILGSGNLILDGLPSQTGQSGKFLTTNGTNASWATVTIPNPTYDSINERITW